MSKRSETVAAEECIALGAAGRQLDAYPNRDVNLGALAVAHTLIDWSLSPARVRNRHPTSTYRFSTRAETTAPP